MNPAGNRHAAVADAYPESIAPQLPEIGRRDLSIDAVRGICIVMMITSHIAAGSILDKVAHPSVWVDGASGFVLFSGLLVGIVQRSVRERQGDMAGIKKLTKRIGIVYAGHLWLCLTAFVAVALSSSRDDVLPSVEDQGGTLGALARSLTLQINPYFASILSMYVVLMIFALGSLWLLRNGYLTTLIILSSVLVVFGTLFPEWTALPRESGIPGPITLASWHGLFTIGLIAGWYWRTSRMRDLMSSRVAFSISVIAALAGVVVARLLKQTSFGSSDWIHDLFSKDQMGPGRIVVSVLTYYLVYRILTRILSLPRWRSALSPLTFLGKRSLDSYLILSTVVLALPAMWTWDQSSSVAMALTVIVGGGCLVWAWFRANSTLPIVGLARRQNSSSKGSGT